MQREYGYCMNWPKLQLLVVQEKLLGSIHIIFYWMWWSGMIMGEEEKKFELDALEVFQVLRKWKKKLKHNKQKLNNQVEYNFI